MYRSSFDIPVDEFMLTFALPEDTQDIEFEMGTIKPVKVNRRSYRTYFSTTREKEISFEFTNMTREELEKPIAVLFNFPFWGTLRKPLVALSTLVFLVIGALYLNRLDLSLKEKGKGKNKATGKGRVKSASEALKDLYQKRREILMNYEDLIAGNMNTRPNVEQLKNYIKLRNQFEEQLNLIENSIFEKIKNNSRDAQKAGMNSIALKRLYDDQISIFEKILTQVCDKFTDSIDSVDDSFSSKSLNFNSISSIGNVSKMSKSASDDLMTLSRPTNKIVENYASEAVKLDLQIVEYESKFLAVSN